MTTPNAASFDDMARQYALGELDEPRRLEIEERLVVDPDAHEALLLVADDLAEDYLDGQMSDQDRRNFEQHYLATPDHQARLRFLKLLRSQPVEPVVAVEPVATVNTRPFWTRVPVGRAMANACRQYPQWASAALVALIAWGAFGAWLAVDRVRQERQHPNLADAVKVPPPTDRLSTAVSITQNNLQLAQAALRRAELAAVPPDFLLQSGLQRGAGTMPRLPIPDEAIVVRLRLDLPAVSGVTAHRAAVVDQDGRRIYEVALRDADTNAGVVPLVVPTEYLPRGDYRVVVTASAADGTPQTVAAFPFRIMKQVATERPATIP